MVHKILFIHHSTGANLINEGHLREELKKVNPNIELWDHSYNLVKFLPSFIAKYIYLTGLSDSHGKMTGTDYNIFLSNNSPKEYADIFSRPIQDKTLRFIFQYDVIIFKNCFPTTLITSDKLLEEDKKYYEIIAENIVRYKDKRFIILTPPPLRQEATKKEYAARAILLASWLKSKEFSGLGKNIHIFDFFGLLADDKGMLKKEYCNWWPIDSHPNKKANMEIAPLLAKYINEVVH